MNWLRDRAAMLAGILCLFGQGILLFATKSGLEMPMLVQPLLFVLFALGFIFALAIWLRAHSPENSPRCIFWRLWTMAAAMALLGVSFFLLLIGGKVSSQTDDYSSNLELAAAQVEEIEPSLAAWWARAEPTLLAQWPTTSQTSSVADGELFRTLEFLPELWASQGAQSALGVVVWQEGERVAWAGEVEPLALSELPEVDRDDRGWTGQLIRGRRGWYYRRWTTWLDETSSQVSVIEVQLKLTEGDRDEILAGVELVVGPVKNPILTMDESGLMIRPVNFGVGDSGPYAHLLARTESAQARRGVTRARLLLGLLVAWSCALLGWSRLALRSLWGVLLLWLGRSLLAAGSGLSWVGAAFVQQNFPASPGSWFALVDPAYFATPFAGGWFASTADALLSAVLVAGTVWYLIRRQGLVSDSDEGPDTPPVRALLKPRWWGGLCFGVVGGGVLLILERMAYLVAQNANPRLIGVGVSISSLSFWGLQIVLLLFSFALVALLTSFIAGNRWPARDRMWTWWAGGLLAGAVAVLVVFVGSADWWLGRLLAAVTIAGLWFVAPALQSRPYFLRRFAWSFVMLLAVCWNYTALREVYDDAERTWLEAKGRQITEADPEWTRYLLGSVLQDMVVDDSAAVAAVQGFTDDLWRDEAAWRLYSNSALNDLGYRCSVEIIDPQDYEESFFALGFMNNPQYELSARGPRVDLSGAPMVAATGTVFQTERRKYQGGEEEVLTAETPRADGRGWLRVELPVRSWRVSTLSRTVAGERVSSLGKYQPRSEVDRPVLLLLADDSGWLDAGPTGIPAAKDDGKLQALRRGELAWAHIEADGDSWLCLWKSLPTSSARGAGEGFLLGLRRWRWHENALDLSRLMLLDMVLLFAFFIVLQVVRTVVPSVANSRRGWRPGFQERFLAGYLVLGLVLLVVVGMSVDQVGYERVQAEARDGARVGLVRAVEQLRALLTEQARSLVDSEYIDTLMRGQYDGQHPAGAGALRQGMVFNAAGDLLLDETLSDLSPLEGRALLNAGRNSPLVVVRDRDGLFVGVVIPVHLGDWLDKGQTEAESSGHAAANSTGFFFYRQRLDKGLIAALAELVTGQITLDVGGQPMLASHPTAVFSGAVPLLSDTQKMRPVLDNQHGASVFAAIDRPFAFTAARPLIALSRNTSGQLTVDALPAVLNVAFPDRERNYAGQRNRTILFLAGLANIVLLTALLLALLMSWNIFGPLRVLLAATRSLARGDYDAPLPEVGGDEIGRLAGAFGAMRTELSRARDDLAAREQFLSVVLDRVTMGVAVVSADEHLVVLNPAGRRIVNDFRPGDEEEDGVLALMRDFGKQGAGELVSRDGKRTVRGALAPLELPGDRIDTMLVFEDVTDFLQTKKMAMNAELARQVAHEIKNPLTPIQLSVQLLQQAWRDNHPDRERILNETVERVLQQVKLLRSIASEFSLLGRPDALEPEPMDLAGVVHEMVDSYSPGAGGGLAKIEIAAVELPAVNAHRESLQKILGNVIQNSLDAARPETPLHVDVQWRVADDTVTMIWQDNGTGLAPEVAERLFDPYFSTKSKGTGLGLAISRNLVDRMRGKISLSNRSEGSGAVTELTLPRARPGK